MERLIKETAGRMRGWPGKSHSGIALMSWNDAEMSYVRAGAVSVLGGALWWSSGPETTTTKRTWKETLGWDDGLSLSTPR